VIGTSLREAGATDDVARTISYSDVAKRARAIVEGPPRSLIESVAEEIATTILVEFPRAESVAVTLRKPNAPITGMIFDSVAVRVRRSREQPS
jgi:dihydroneopterin aldolase